MRCPTFLVMALIATFACAPPQAHGQSATTPTEPERLPAPGEPRDQVEGLEVPRVVPADATPAASSTAAEVRIDVPPQVLARGTLAYPPAARAAGVEGTVLVRALIDTLGHVTEAQIQTSVPMLDSTALAFVRGWRFRPAEVDHRPVAVWVTTPVRFVITEHRDSPAALKVPPAARPAPQSALAGRYFVDDDTTVIVIVTPTGPHTMDLESSSRWVGSGELDSAGYHGGFRYPKTASDPTSEDLRGTHEATAEPDGRWRVHGEFVDERGRAFDVTWTPVGMPPPRGTRRLAATDAVDSPPESAPRPTGPVRMKPAPGTQIVSAPPSEAPQPSEPAPIERRAWPPPTAQLPAQMLEHPAWPPEWRSGVDGVLPVDTTPVDSLPRVVRRVDPAPFPSPGRPTSLDGLIVVKLRVERDGSVGEAAIAESIPVMDEPALRAVRQWRFRPALRRGKPIPLWVYVPVRVSAH